MKDWFKIEQMNQCMKEIGCHKSEKLIFKKVGLEENHVAVLKISRRRNKILSYLFYYSYKIMTFVIHKFCLLIPYFNFDICLDQLSMKITNNKQ